MHLSADFRALHDSNDELVDFAGGDRNARRSFYPMRFTKAALTIVRDERQSWNIYYNGLIPYFKKNSLHQKM
jgi:hypothetical protein